MDHGIRPPPSCQRSRFKSSNLNVTHQPMELACNPQRDIEFDAGLPVNKSYNRWRMEALPLNTIHTETTSSKACLGGKMDAF